tara:strand:+ start:46 stop:885 length:840 start_codon:yes stop_codon:yes gene_type:complete
MVSIVEAPTRMQFFSIWTDRSTARSARRKARKMFRDFIRLNKLTDKEKEAYEKGDAGKLEKDLKKIADTLKSAFELAMEEIKKQDILELRLTNKLISNLKLVSSNPDLAKDLKNELDVIKDFSLKQLRRLERLSRWQKPEAVLQFGTNELAVVKDLKRAAWDERKDARQVKKSNKGVKKSVKHPDLVSQEIREFVKKVGKEEKDINQALIDDFVATYYLLKHIDEEESKIKEYVQKGFSKSVGDKLFEEFEIIRAEFSELLSEAYSHTRALHNLITRAA